MKPFHLVKLLAFRNSQPTFPHYSVPATSARILLDPVKLFLLTLPHQISVVGEPKRVIMTNDHEPSLDSVRS